MRPYYVAIVGAGPSGFFAAASLLRFADESVAADGPDVHIDMIEMLPTPWGLVRSGVAPDHPKIKSVSRTFEKSADDQRFRYFGNITVGEHVSTDDLAQRYDAVVYTVGTQSDRPMGIPGENLPGSVAAVDFVGWYNAHPHFAGMAPDISSGRAVVIGNGNVAIDVARILVTDPEVLAATDIADHALDALRRRGVSEVVIVGRRGPLQGAFTTLELRELGELDGVEVVVDPVDLAGITDEEAAAAGKATAANIKVLRGYAEKTTERTASGEESDNRRIVFRFHRSPVEITGWDKVESIVLGHNELVTDENGRTFARDTGERESLPAQLVVRAVGYRGVAMAGLPFDDASGTIPHEHGRVAGRLNSYVAGWIKRGPSGVIGTNKKDAQDTVDTLLADLAGTQLREVGEGYADELATWLSGCQPHLVTEAHWQAIDTHERSAGEGQGRPRVKLATVADLLTIAHG